MPYKVTTPVPQTRLTPTSSVLLSCQSVWCENFHFPSRLQRKDLCDHLIQKVQIRALLKHAALVFQQLVRPACSLSKIPLQFSLFQTIWSTVQKASPQRFSASTSLPWRETRPTSSEQSFGLWGCQTPAPRGLNNGLSSTRCVKVPFPCPSTKIRLKATRSFQNPC